MGKTPSRNNAEYWNSNEYKWISIADLSKTGKYIRDTKEHLSKQAIDESGIKLIPANTVIMSFKLSIGKTAITAEDMYSNEAIMAFHDKHVVDILPEYLFYMFKFKNWDEGSNKAVMGKTLNKATLSDVEIDVCSIEKQREIVDILNKIMNILENRDNEIVLLDNLIKARFVEMFVKNEYDWKEVTIAEVCIDMRTGPFGSSLHHDEFVDKGVFVLGIDNAVENTFSYNRMRYITEEKYEKLKFELLCAVNFEISCHSNHEFYSSIYRYGYEIVKSNYHIFIFAYYTDAGKHRRFYYGKQCYIPCHINAYLTDFCFSLHTGC